MHNEFRRYFLWGLTAFLVLLALLFAVIVLTNFSGVSAAVNSLLYILSPVIYGFVFAYLLNPIAKAVEQVVDPFLRKRGVADRRAHVSSRVAGIVLALLFALALIYALFAMIIPQMADSIAGIVSNLSGYYETARNWLQNLLEDEPTLKGYANTVLERVYIWLENWVETGLSDALQKVMITITSSVVSVVRSVLYMVIGLIISVYILASRDKFLAQTKKLIIAVFRPARADRIMELGRRCHRIFGGFITGKILDSLIIGILCFAGMSILKLPYPVLIATIVGVTNVIPFFGPYIGAIPSALLILFVSPLQCFYFVVFILVLQQFDGNVLGPHILGDATGLSGFWVVVSITVAGGLFGFMGMLLGVPVFALIYTLISDWVETRLAKKNFDTRTRRYYSVHAVGDLLPECDTEPAEAAGHDDTQFSDR